MVIIKELAPLLLAVAAVIASITALVTALRTKKENKEEKAATKLVQAATQQVKDETQQVKEEAQAATTDAQEVTFAMRETLDLYKNTVRGLQANEAERRKEIRTLREEITQCEEKSARAEKEVLKLQALNTDLNADLRNLIRRVEELLEQERVKNAATSPATARGVHYRHNLPFHHRTTHRQGRIVRELAKGQVLVQWEGGGTAAIAAEEIVEE